MSTEYSIDSNPASVRQPVKSFVDGVASPSAAPGAGSVSAIVGSLSAALTTMVCGLTVNRKSYAHVSEEMRQVLEEAAELKDQLTALAEKDVEAYDEVSRAYHLRNVCGITDEECQNALNAALLNASEIPLQIARAAKRILALALIAAEKGNINAVCDAGVAALLADTSLQASRLTVQLNLAPVPCSPRKDAMLVELKSILGDTAGVSELVVQLVQKRTGGSPIF